MLLLRLADSIEAHGEELARLESNNCGKPYALALNDEIPAIADVLKGFEGSPVNYLSVRAGTPQAIIDRLNREVNAVLESPELKDQLTKSGVIPKGSTPAEMAALIRSEAEKWRKVIQEAKISPPA